MKYFYPEDYGALGDGKANEWKNIFFRFNKDEKECRASLAEGCNFKGNR